jgi:hypothetical protein
MTKNVHVVNFQDLKKFLHKEKSFFKINKQKKNSNIDDCKIFGAAYHKILEQDKNTFISLVKRNSIPELDKLINNFNLKDKAKKTLLLMIRKFYESKVYQKYIARSKFIHNEQNICHFIMKDSYIFRLEAIVDAIISFDGVKKIIIDYKTINNIFAIDKTINDNFYWFQLLFYRYILESNFKDDLRGGANEIHDLYLIFQSKSDNNNFDIILKKFSDLSRKTKNSLKNKFYSGLNDYMRFVLQNKRDGRELSFSQDLINNFYTKKSAKFSIIKFIEFVFRAAIVSCVFGFLWVLYRVSKSLF